MSRFCDKLFWHRFLWKLFSPCAKLDTSVFKRKARFMAQHLKDNATVINRVAEKFLKMAFSEILREFWRFWHSEIWYNNEISFVMVRNLWDEEVEGWKQRRVGLWRSNQGFSLKIKFWTRKCWTVPHSSHNSSFVLFFTEWKSLLRKPQC